MSGTPLTHSLTHKGYLGVVPENSQEDQFSFSTGAVPRKLSAFLTNISKKLMELVLLAAFGVYFFTQALIGRKLAI